MDGRSGSYEVTSRECCRDVMRRFRIFALTLSLLALVALLPGCAGLTKPTPPAPTVAQSGTQTATFSDANLEAAIRSTLGKPAGEEITTAELTKLTQLPCAGSVGINDISWLQHCTNLTTLSLSGIGISDISFLSSLTKLNMLIIASNQIRDIRPLSSLTNLTELHIWGNQISDISPLLANGGFGAGDMLWLKNNSLDLREGSKDMDNIRVLQQREVIVEY